MPIKDLEYESIIVYINAYEVHCNSMMAMMASIHTRIYQRFNNRIAI